MIAPIAAERNSKRDGPLSDPSPCWAAMRAPHLLLEIAHAMTRRLSSAKGRRYA